MTARKETSRRKRRTGWILGPAVTALAVTGLAPVPAATAAEPSPTGEAVITLGTYGGRTAKPEQIALGGGRLTVAGWAEPVEGRALYEYDLPAHGGVEPGPRRLVQTSFWMNYPCGNSYEMCNDFDSRLWALGDGRVAYHAPDHGGPHASGGQVPSSELSLGHWGPDLVADAAGQYVVVNNLEERRQLIGSFDAEDASQESQDGLVHSRPITASSVWGDRLWQPGTAAGTVSAYDLRTKTTTPDIDVDPGSNCVPDSLQAVGRWLFWQCDEEARAGVWDHRKAAGIPVEAKRWGRLGDGFLVGDPTEGELRLLDFHRGAGETPSERVLAQRPAISQWTVDKYGGHVAYVDEESRIRIVPVDVPRSPVTAIDARTDTTLDLRPASKAPVWSGHWRLSRPAAAWTLIFRDGHGNVARKLTGTARDGAAIRATWDGRTADGRLAAGRPHTWDLIVDPGDGGPHQYVSKGTTRVVGGRSVHRDADGDGLGEHYAMTTGGKLSVHHLGTTTGTYVSQGWDPATRFIPFGDMDGDGCDDMLLKSADGLLRRAAGECDGHYTPVDHATPHVQIGKGWNAFDAVVAPGDLTGDGRPDLLARQTTTGYLFLYRSNASGTLDAAVRVGTGWKGYRLIGAGDIDGDGNGDLLARDGSGELWRYGGTGKGTLKPRVLVFRDWGAGRTDIVGVGDVTGDSLPDLLSRDSSGKLLRNKGNGKGSFGATVTISTGWQNYRGLY
ncbi:FG-GAP-like repeat-containing protein [Streptomyces sp. NPDC047821]|uniref:FG-GAP-like repeat-containing protein n=1 Tax=Streptomyces sp. NPDC047821 TaxID=3365488 RepID=UPI0037161B8D